MEKKSILLTAFLLATIIFTTTAFAAIPDTNIWKVDNNDINVALPLFSYARDGSLTITFWAKDADQNDLNATLYFGLAKGARTTQIFSDLNLSILNGCNTNDSNAQDGMVCARDWDISGIADNNYFLTIDVNDGADVKTFEVEKSFLVDNTAPTISNFTPAIASNSSTPTISFDLNDAYSGLNFASTTIKIDGSIIDGNIISQITSSHVSYALPAVPDKNVVVDINAADNAGNNLFASIGFLVDTNAPTTTASGCISSGWNNSSQPISFSCNDSNSGCNTIYYSTDSSGSWTTAIGTTASTTLSDGNHQIEYYSTDNAGNTESQHIKEYYCAVDTTGPSVSLSASTSGHTVYLNWSATDVSGIQNVTLFREGVSAGSILSQNPYQWPEASDGTYHYRVMARDNTGHDANSSEISVPVSSSSTGSTSSSSSSSNPATIWIKLSISSADFAKLGKYSITLNGDEPFAGGYQVKIKLPNSSNYKDIASSASYSGKSVTVEYEFKAGEDGNASISAVAWSSSGSRAEAQKTIMIDTKAPSIELVAPKANDLLSGTVALKANATDANASAKDVSFYYRKGTSGNWQPIAAAATKTGTIWSGKWNTAGLADGQYQFRAVASDAAGNTAEKIIDLKVSNIAGLGITGNAEIAKEALFSFNESDLNAMFSSVLENDTLAEEAIGLATDCNVSRTLKIIKITDDANKTSYKASVFLGFRNNSSKNMSVQLVEVVPKDFAQSASAIESTEPFSIIENDPIISWDLNNVPAGKAVEIVYSLKGNLTQDFAMNLAESSSMQKFSAPPILVSTTSQLNKKDFVASLSSTPLTGFLGFIGDNALAIIAGLVIAGIIVSALFISKSGFSFGGGSGYSGVAGAKPEDWTYREKPHEKIIGKISSSLEGLIGFSEGTQTKRKWIFKKETGLEEKKPSGLKQLVGGLDFTIAKKQEPKAEGKGKWSSGKYKNDDI